jgi:hypothetical protein
MENILFKNEVLPGVYKMFASTPLGKLTLLIETKVSLLSEVEVSAIEIFASGRSAN